MGWFPTLGVVTLQPLELQKLLQHLFSAAHMVLPGPGSFNYSSRIITQGHGFLLATPLDNFMLIAILIQSPKKSFLDYYFRKEHHNDLNFNLI